jgi:hypothetical protein
MNADRGQESRQHAARPRQGSVEKRSILMRKLVLTLLVVAGIVIGLGFYPNWFSWAPKGGDDQTHNPVTVDKEKIQSDVQKGQEKVKVLTEKGKEKAKDLTEKAKNVGGGDNEKTKGAIPAVQAKEKDQ